MESATKGLAQQFASILSDLERDLPIEVSDLGLVRGEDANSPMSATEVETYVKSRLIGIPRNKATVTITWTPNNSPGGTVQRPLDYTYAFFFGSLVGLDPLAIEGDSSMVVL